MKKVVALLLSVMMIFQSTLPLEMATAFANVQTPDQASEEASSPVQIADPEQESTEEGGDEPAGEPSDVSTGEPSGDEPSAEPNDTTTDEPVSAPTEEPTDASTDEPGTESTGNLAQEQTGEPSSEPTGTPTASPESTAETTPSAEETIPEAEATPSTTPTNANPADTCTPKPEDEPTESPALTSSPEPTVSPEPTPTATPVPTPTLASLAVGLRADASSGFLHEQTSFTATLAGGLPPYTLDWTQGNAQGIDAAEYTFSYTHKSSGNVTVKLTVTDSTGSKASASASIPVAEHEGENEETWQRSVSGAGKRSGDWRRDLVAVAETQLGYTHSEKDFIVDGDGVRHAYTRYGAWYGNDYADCIDAMFVSFCLSFAHIPDEDFPQSDDVNQLRDGVSSRGALESTRYTPSAGDLVFLYTDEGGVGIVSDVGNGEMTVIMATTNGRVTRTGWRIRDERVEGFANMTKLMIRAGKLEPTVKPTEEPTQEPTAVPTPEPSVEITPATPDEAAKKPATPGEADEEPAPATPDEAEKPETYTYSALNGAVTATAQSEGELIASVIAEDDPLYTQSAEQFAMLLGEDMTAMKVFDIEFVGEGSAEIALRLDAAEFDGCPLMLVHFSEEYGWEQLPFEKEEVEAAIVLRFTTDSFSPFAVLTMNKAPYDNLANGDPFIVTDITGSGTAYNPTTGDYDTSLKLLFTSYKNAIHDGEVYSFTYPQGVIVPEKLYQPPQRFTLRDLHEGAAGEYWYVKNADGTYTVNIDYDETYVANAGTTIEGYVQLEGSLHTVKQEDGSIHLGDGSTTIHIDGAWITYPGEANENYNISVNKDGRYVKNGNKLEYTVIVKSEKGTPGGILLTDEVTGIPELGTFTDVKVERGTYQRYIHGDVGPSYDPNPLSVTPNYDNGKLTMQLPPLAGGSEKQDTNGNGTYFDYNCYKVTYTYVLPNSLKYKDFGVDNTARGESSEGKDTVYQESPKHINIKGSHSLSKEGSYQAATDRIKWTIIINNNKSDIADAVLTDPMLANLTKGQNVSVSPDRDYELMHDDPQEPSKITGIKFKAPEGKEINEETYTITYYTDANSSFGGSSNIDNTATFDPDPNGGGGELTDGASVPVNAGAVDKVRGDVWISDDKTTGTIQWTVNITIPGGGLPANKPIVDEAGTGNYQGIGKLHWMSFGQIETWLNSSWTWGNGKGVFNPLTFGVTVKLKTATNGILDATEYTYEQVKSSPELQNKQFAVAEISFDKALLPPDGEGNTLTYTYSTTIDPEPENVEIGSSTRYYNKISVENKSDTDEYNRFQSGVIKTDGDGQKGTTTPESNGNLTWKVVVVTREVCGELTITDSLPAADGTNGNVKVILDSISIGDAMNGTYTVDSASGNITGENNDYIISYGHYNKENGEVVLKVKRKNEGETIPAKTKFIFTYACHAEGNEVVALVPDTQYTFKNSVTVKEDETPLGSSEQTQKWTYKEPTVVTHKLSKSGEWTQAERRLDYTLEINPEGLSLAGGAPSLTLTDRLDYYSKSQATKKNTNIQYDITFNATLLQNTVKLYKAKKDAAGNVMKDENGKLIPGAPVADWKWTVETVTNAYGDANKAASIITADIPNSTPLIMVYAYKFSTSLENGDTWTPNNSIGNYAVLDGETVSDNRVQDQWENLGTEGGVITEKRYIFTKVNKDNYSETLKDVVFSVYACDEDGVPQEPAYRTYTTKEDGKVVIAMDETETNRYAYNTLYMLKETQPAPGFQMPEPVQEYYFFYSKAGQTNNLPPETVLAQKSAIDLSNSPGESAFVENVKDDTKISIKVDKEWFEGTREITDEMTNEDAIEFDLWRIVSEKDPGGSSGGSGSGGNTISYSVVNAWNASTVYASGQIEGAAIGSTIQYTLTAPGANIYNFPTVAFFSGATEKDAMQWDFNATPPTCKGTATVTGSSVVITSTKFNADNQEPYSIVVTSLTQTPTDPEPVNPPAGDRKEEYGPNPHTLNKSNDWWTTINDLPRTGTENGKKVYYSYYVKERAVNGYTTSYGNNEGITSGTITITNTKDQTPPSPTKTSIKVMKTWPGFGDTDERGQVTIELYQVKNGKDVTKLTDKTIHLPKDGNVWEDTISDLVVDDGNGNTYTYYVKEVVDGNENFTVTYNPANTTVKKTGTTENDTTISDPISRGTVTVANTKKETLSLTVRKEWTQANGSADAPANNAKVTLQLYQKPQAGSANTYGAAVTLPDDAPDRSKPWEYAFTDLPAKDTDGNAYSYYVVEDVTLTTPKGYTATYKLESATGDGNTDATQVTVLATSGDKTIVVKNTQEETELTVEKKWLKADGTTGFTIDELPDGASATVQLFQKNSDGTVSPVKVNDADVAFTFNETNGWGIHTFPDLPKKDEATGDDITYYVQETARTPEDFAISYSTPYPDTTRGDMGAFDTSNAATVTNKEPTTEIVVTKAWKDTDGSNITSNLPNADQIEFQLYKSENGQIVAVTANGQPVTTKPVVDKDGSWTAKFENLPMKDASGVIQYYVKETSSLTDFTASYSGAIDAQGSIGFVGTVENGKVTITNTKQFTFGVEKRWIGPDGATSIDAPTDARVTVQLYEKRANQATPNALTGYTVILETGKWIAEFPAVPAVDESGATIEYYVKEDLTNSIVPTGFTVSYDIPTTFAPDTEVYGKVTPNAANGINVTITNAQPSTSLSIYKDWKNASGESIPALTDKVYFKLMQYQTNGNAENATDVNWNELYPNGMPECVETVNGVNYIAVSFAPTADATKNASNGGAELSGLPTDREFTVAEMVEVDGKLTELTADNARWTYAFTPQPTESGDPGATVKIFHFSFTNTEKAAYLLPAAGAAGTTTVYAASGLLMMLAALLLAKKRRRA